MKSQIFILKTLERVFGDPGEFVSEVTVNGIEENLTVFENLNVKNSIFFFKKSPNLRISPDLIK